jgi:hypothetical protein
MRLSLEMKKIIRNELLTDPAGRGYAAKSPQEMADLINVSFMAEKSPATTLENQPVRWGDVRGLANAAGEWPNVMLRAEERPATSTVKAAMNAVSMGDDRRLDPKDTRAWSAFQAGMAALEKAGDLSPETVAEMNALTTVAVPAVIEEQHARIMEIFIRNPVALPDDFGAYELTAEDVGECLA